MMEMILVGFIVILIIFRIKRYWFQNMVVMVKWKVVVKELNIQLWFFWVIWFLMIFCFILVINFLIVIRMVYLLFFMVFGIVCFIIRGVILQFLFLWRMEKLVVIGRFLWMVLQVLILQFFLEMQFIDFVVQYKGLMV